MSKRWMGALLSLTLAMGCAAEPEIADAAAEDADACGLCGGKADGWSAPREGSCQAEAMLQIANEASFEELDIDARLNARAAEHIVEARKQMRISTLAALDAVKFVGPAALEDIFLYAGKRGALARCEREPQSFELQLISDLDKTVVPPNEAPPYPGVVRLYEILEHGSDGLGQAGDTTYVTARKPERVTEMPAYFVEHGLPRGEIQTGITGFPPVAQAEKVRDISTVFAASQARQYVMFGDSSHRDPEAYREAIEAHPDFEVVALIHRVTEDEEDARFEGLFVYENYAEAAAILAQLGILSQDDAWSVFEAATAQGLEMTRDQMDALLTP